MVEAEKVGFWGGRYAISVDGSPVTTFESATWRSGGTFELEGRPYRVSSGIWGSRYELGEGSPPRPVAGAERVGRRQWTVTAGERTYRFRRASFWSGDQELLDGDAVVGTVRRRSMWTGGVRAELPGLTPALQVFVVAVVLSMWEAQAAAGASAS